MQTYQCTNGVFTFQQPDAILIPTARRRSCTRRSDLDIGGRRQHGRRHRGRNRAEPDAIAQLLLAGNKARGPGPARRLSRSSSAWTPPAASPRPARAPGYHRLRAVHRRLHVLGQGLRNQSDATRPAAACLDGRGSASFSAHSRGDPGIEQSTVEYRCDGAGSPLVSTARFRRSRGAPILAVVRRKGPDSACGPWLSRRGTTVSGNDLGSSPGCHAWWVATRRPHVHDQAADAGTWEDFASLVEANNGVWGGCWCIGLPPRGRRHRPHPGRQPPGQTRATSRRAPCTRCWCMPVRMRRLVPVRLASRTAEHQEPCRLPQGAADPARLADRLHLHRQPAPRRRRRTRRPSRHPGGDPDQRRRRRRGVPRTGRGTPAPTGRLSPHRTRNPVRGIRIRPGPADRKMAVGHAPGPHRLIAARDLCRSRSAPCTPTTQSGLPRLPRLRLHRHRRRHPTHPHPRPLGIGRAAETAAAEAVAVGASAKQRRCQEQRQLTRFAAAAGRLNYVSSGPV